MLLLMRALNLFLWQKEAGGGADGAVIRSDPDVARFCSRSAEPLSGLCPVHRLWLELPVLPPVGDK